MTSLFPYTPILFTGSTEVALWTIATASVGTVAFAAWTMGFCTSKQRAPFQCPLR
jgi:hypothetical protein